MQCCPLTGADEADGTMECFEQRVVVAKKTHRCLECRLDILPGTSYEYAKGLWESEWSTFKTCLSCVEIRNHFACSNGYLFGQLWEDIESNFFPGMTAGGPCMEGLSPGAKARLFDLRLKWLEDTSS